jgi:hypothetical protein
MIDKIRDKLYYLIIVIQMIRYSFHQLLWIFIVIINLMITLFLDVIVTELIPKLWHLQSVNSWSERSSRYQFDNGYLFDKFSVILIPILSNLTFNSADVQFAGLDESKWFLIDAWRLVAIVKLIARRTFTPRIDWLRIEGQIGENWNQNYRKLIK